MRGSLFAVNDYALSHGSEPFRLAIAALAARVRHEGEPGVLGYRFFCDADGLRARAIVTYDGASAWIGHHERSFGWAEMKALHAAGRLTRVTLLGDVSDEVRDWIAASGLTAEVQFFPTALDGFDR